MKRTTLLAAAVVAAIVLATLLLAFLAPNVFASESGAVSRAEVAFPGGIWRMEDPTQMLDVSGNDNHGTTTDIRKTRGFEDKGYRFNGSSSIVTVPSSDSLNPGEEDLLLTAYVKFDKAPSKAVGDYDLIRKGVSATPGGDYKMEILPSKNNTQAKAFCFFKDSSKTVGQIVAGPNLADGAWHELACAKTETEVQLSVDRTTYTEEVSLGSISNDNPVTVGAKTPGADPYKGSMDEVSMDTNF